MAECFVHNVVFAAPAAIVVIAASAIVSNVFVKIDLAGILWFAFIFSLKQHLRPLRYFAPLLLVMLVMLKLLFLCSVCRSSSCW